MSAVLYVMSDIHGCYRELAVRIAQLNNLHTVIDKGGKDTLILLGDYIDGGDDSCKVIESIFALQQNCPERVIVLRGNHEDWFLAFLDGKEDTWLGADMGLKTSRTFLTGEQLEQVKKLALAGCSGKIYPFVRKCIRENHTELIAWMRTLPYYYETENQIFVHAGVDEEAGEWWKVGTSNDCLANKYPPTTGKFCKDIIAGHVATSTLAGDINFHNVYYDGKSHYFIDGTVAVGGSILVLVYKEETNEYLSLEHNGNVLCFNPVKPCVK